MTIYDSPGEVVTLTAPTGGVVKDIGKLIGSLFVVPTITVAETLKFTGLVTGVVYHQKTSAQAWTEGVKIYFITATGLMTTSAGGNTLVGVAARAAVNPSGSGYVRLDGFAR